MNSLLDNSFFIYLIFPGFIFTALVGIVASWIDRKVTARVQWRKGPPLLQPLYDLIKLSGKETILPKGGSKFTFLLAPLLGLASIVIVSAMLWRTLLDPSTGFVGDLIVLIYLIAIPSLALIMGAFASANPLASLGASREIKLILAYELPFVFVVGIAIINHGNAIQLGSFISGWTWSISALIALVVAVLCQQAKLALVPFDAPEAETEIMGGAIIEYSGMTLLIHKLTRMMMLFVLPMFLVVVFLGGISFISVQSIVVGLLKYVALLVVIVLIRNTAPRLRIDQALRFFWGPVAILAVIGVILAFLGY